MVREEHITLVEEPGSKFIGHYSVKSGSTDGISNVFFECMQKNNVDLAELKVIGCDGTAVNTGEKGGTIRLIEVKLNRPLHHIICQLHANELQLPHLMEKLDGKTSGPLDSLVPLVNNYKVVRTTQLYSMI